MRHYKLSLFFKSGMLLLLVLTFGCSFISDEMRGGIGQPISTRIDKWGPPSRVTSDGMGGSIYIWEIWNADGWGMRKLETTMFWVDSEGIIYKWR
jgi:hypothetical protein